MESQATQKSETSIPSEFFSLKVTRDETGVRIFVRSKEMERFLARNGETTHYDNQGSSFPGYAWPSITSTEAYGFSRDTNALWSDSNGLRPNLSILLRKGLGEGITVSLPGLVSRDALIRWTEAMRKALRSIWLDYASPMEIEQAIIFQSIERI